MKKKFSFFLFVLVLVVFSFSTNSFAVEDDVNYENGQIISESDSLDEAYLTYTTEDLTSLLGDMTDNSIDPLADDPERSKTITKFYEDFDQIREYEHYQEDHDGHGWSGYLFLTYAEKVNGGWEATFSGYINALVE